MQQQQRHEMQLDERWWRAVASGRKTIEVRFFDEKRRAVAPGDVVVWTRRGSGDVVATRVVALTIAPLAAFPRLFPLKNILPGVKTQKAFAALCASIYGEEKAERGLFVGFHLEPAE